MFEFGRKPFQIDLNDQHRFVPLFCQLRYTFQSVSSLSPSLGALPDYRALPWSTRSARSLAPLSQAPRSPGPPRRLGSLFLTRRQHQKKRCCRGNTLSELIITFQFSRSRAEAPRLKPFTTGCRACGSKGALRRVARPLMRKLRLRLPRELSSGTTPHPRCSAWDSPGAFSWGLSPMFSFCDTLCEKYPWRVSLRMPRGLYQKERSWESLSGQSSGCFRGKLSPGCPSLRTNHFKYDSQPDLKQFRTETTTVNTHHGFKKRLSLVYLKGLCLV